jgi:glycosyltransferase involved in cell wall biosynthesis
VPKHFINHGVSKTFLDECRLDNYVPGSPLRIGYAGNLLRTDIDTACLLQIIRENPEVQFEFWGAYKYTDSNIGGAGDDEKQHFVQALLNQGNVVLHGPVPSSELAKAYTRIDAFIICYDILKDQSKGTNYHKVIEYLSTGKVIISNNITTYKHTKELLVMANSRNSNEELPGIFKEVIGSIAYYNSKELMQKRRQYAEENLYPRQLELIEEILQHLN